MQNESNAKKSIIFFKISSYKKNELLNFENEVVGHPNIST